MPASAVLPGSGRPERVLSVSCAYCLALSAPGDSIQPDIDSRLIGIWREIALDQLPHLAFAPDRRTPDQRLEVESSITSSNQQRTGLLQIDEARLEPLASRTQIDMLGTEAAMALSGLVQGSFTPGSD